MISQVSSIAEDPVALAGSQFSNHSQTLYMPKAFVGHLSPICDCRIQQGKLRSQMDALGLDARQQARAEVLSKSYYEKHGISVVKTVVFSLRDMAFGMARVYDAFSYGAPETVKVFRGYQSAVQWLNE